MAGTPQRRAGRPLGQTVAGRFYPAEPRAFEAMVRLLSQQARRDIQRPFRALVVPHAGLGYSGTPAISAWASLENRKAITTVFLLSPGHHTAFDGVAIPAVETFRTILGPVHCASALQAKSARIPGVCVRDDLFENEHGVEMHLPFIRSLMPQARVLPVIAGRGAMAPLAEILAMAEETPDALIVVSSDLSHYLAAGEAEERDARTARQIEHLAPDVLEPGDACGSQPLKAVLALARARDWRPLRLDLTHSGRTAGNPDRVVGYGAWGFEPARTAQLSHGLRVELLRAARKTLEIGLRRGKVPEINLDTFPMPLRGEAATFVTLKTGGKLRGCIGSYAPRRSMIADVAENTFAAGFRDPRFKPLGADELPLIDLSISILSTPRKLAVKSEEDLTARLQPDVDGLILDGGGKRSIFLPSVWADIPDPRAFVAALKRKGGFPENEWPETMTAWTYGAEVFANPAQPAAPDAPATETR